MTDPVGIISKTFGLNNKMDQFQAAGWYLAATMNVTVSNSGFIELAPGYSILDGTYQYHSGFCNKGDAFVVQDLAATSDLMRVVSVGPGNTVVLGGVRSNLIKGNRVGFCQVGAQTFYANGVQNGVATDGVSSAWPDQSGHVGAGTTREFYPAPIGKHLEWWLTSMWIAVDNIIYVSEPASVGKFRPNGRRFDFGADVIMMKAVEGGMWISTTEEIGFIERADDFKALKWIAKPSRKPAHEWSVNCELVDLSKSALEIPGESAMWSSDDGLCVGTADGQLVVVTEEKLIYPTGSMGATVVDKGICINSVY